MNIQTVIANLLTTIEGKESMLKSFRNRPGTVAEIMADVIEINIKELNDILSDCMKIRETDIVHYLEVKDNTPPKGTHDY